MAYIGAVIESKEKDLSTRSEKLEEIAKAVVHWREIKGYSQTDLARKMKIEPASLNRIEKGKGNLRADTIFKIAEALEIEPVLLLGGYSDEFADLLGKFSRLSQERRRRVLEQVTDLAELESGKG